MKIITNTAELAEFCAECAKYEYVTLDTEFLRERSYYSKLCLLQMAYPGEGNANAVLVDTLSPDLSLDPMYDLFQDASVVKVFHAARQDLEIFFVDRGIFPKPFFDTQVAAMVCGFGEQVGYETLVRRICDKPLDKSSRFTDWSARPLSDKQMHYALGDVTHLREIYVHLRDALAKSNRTSWLEEELAVLTNPATYTIEPDQAWRRVKTRNPSGKLMAIIKELAHFREEYAQMKNIPRSRVYKDDAMMELASTKPTSLNDLSRSRLLLRDARKGPIADAILKAVAKGVATKPEDYPQLPQPKKKAQGAEGLSELLRVLLKAKAEKSGVAQKLIASASDLDEIAAGLRDGPIFSGWRNEVFGSDASRLCEGKVALSAQGRFVKIVNI
jgi:ribonuclease D